jgi:hypothetical protein
MAHRFRLAARVAINRTVAGMHYPVDSGAGAVLGLALAEHLWAVAGQGRAARVSGRLLQPVGTTVISIKASLPISLIKRPQKVQNLWRAGPVMKPAQRTICGHGSGLMHARKYFRTRAKPCPSLRT